MQIISDFHDYYDIGMKTGIDRQLPYRRFRREEYQGDLYVAPDYFWLRVGFAGKVYPAVGEQLDTGQCVYYFFPDKIPEDFYHRAAEKTIRREERYERRRLSKEERKKILKEITNEARGHWEERDYWHDEEEHIPDLQEEFEKNNTAIFVFFVKPKPDGSGWVRGLVFNDRLADYQFQKVFPPIEAFQELAMYVGCNLTRPTIEEPPIADKTKAEIHGFDKFSFRKDKKKK